MSHWLVMTLFPDRASAEAAAVEAHKMGIPSDDLSVVASSHQLEGIIANRVGASPGSEIEDSRPAGLVGEILGAVLGTIAVGIPATGAIVAAGPLAAKWGEAAGHAAGNVSAVLESAGLSVAEAADWHRRIDAGAVLLGVHARHIDPARIEALLGQHGAGRIVGLDWEDQ